MKYIKVEKCYDCPHELIMGHYQPYCGLLNQMVDLKGRRIIHELEKVKTIPIDGVREDCPLPNLEK